MIVVFDFGLVIVVIGNSVTFIRYCGVSFGDYVFVFEFWCWVCWWFIVYCGCLFVLVVWLGLGLAGRGVDVRIACGYDCFVVLVPVGLVFIFFVYVRFCVAFVLYWLLVLGFDFLLFVLLGVFCGYLGWFCCLLIAIICLFVRYTCLSFGCACELFELVMFYTLMGFLGRCLFYWFYGLAIACC